MKNDPRTRYTEMIIKKAFLEFLQQKPMNKISVREICDKAEINRSTFYKHYLDCYDLLDKLKEEALTQLDELMAGIDGHGAMPVLLTVLHTIKNNADMFGLVASNNGVGEFTRKAVQRCYQYLDLRLSVSPERELDAGQKEVRYAFLIGGTSSVIEYWMQRGCVDPPERIAAAILELSESVTTGQTRK